MKKVLIIGKYRPATKAQKRNEKLFYLLVFVLAVVFICVADVH